MGTVAHDVSSFGFLAPYGPLYLRLATGAERALAVDPSLTLVSLRQLDEAFAKYAAARAGFCLRDYQVRAIREIEDAIGDCRSPNARAPRGALHAALAGQAKLGGLGMTWRD